MVLCNSAKIPLSISWFRANKVKIEEKPREAKHTVDFLFGHSTNKAWETQTHEIRQNLTGSMRLTWNKLLANVPSKLTETLWCQITVMCIGGDTYYCTSRRWDEKEHRNEKMSVPVPSTVGWGCSWCGGWVSGITGRRGRCSVWWRSRPLNTSLGPSCTSQTPLSKHQMFKTRSDEARIFRRGETHKPKAYGTKEGKKMATSLPYVVVCRWL